MLSTGNYLIIIIVLLGRNLQISKMNYQLLANLYNKRVQRMTSNNLLVEVIIHLSVEQIEEVSWSATENTGED